MPISLLTDPKTENKANILELEPYEACFGPQKRRKRVKLNTDSLEEIVKQVDDKFTNYQVEKDTNIQKVPPPL